MIASIVNTIVDILSAILYKLINNIIKEHRIKTFYVTDI